MYRPVQNSTSVKSFFFSQKNLDTLQTVLVQDFQRRTGAPLNDQQVGRLQKTLDHYCKEIYEVQGEKPVQYLNKEVLIASAQDFTKYIQRKDSVAQRPTTAVKTVMDDELFKDTAQRFERLTQDRNEVKALPPSVPDFRISMDEDGPSSIELYERAKKARELEALKNSQAIVKNTVDPGMQQFITAGDMFKSQQEGKNTGIETQLVERRMAREHAIHDTPLAILPDRRELLLAPIGSFEGSIIASSPDPRGLGQANSNMTIVQPELMSPHKSDLGQNYIVREDNIVSYREVENNLFVYSADRDWIQNNKENRYNFTVVFDPGYPGNGFGLSPASQYKFKNISRIELVKAIISGESLDVLLQRNQQGGPNITNYQDNILNFPYVSLTVDELDSNNYGTDNSLDKSFGVLQYDANWISDPGVSDTRGYLAMIPKFMKCQQIYHPTPLSTLQKMTIHINQPNGNSVSSVPDTFDIVNILGSNDAIFNSSVYSTVGQPAYFFIQTTSYFSQFSVALGDRIRVGLFTYDPDTLNANPSLRDFANWINQEQGHIVAGIGHIAGGVYSDGPNNVGYANYIIIQARYNDPSTGSTDLALFTSPLPVPDINTYLLTNAEKLLVPRRLIDLNRQVLVVFRIITREMDSISQIRPDNMY